MQNECSKWARGRLAVAGVAAMVALVAGAGALSAAPIEADDGIAVVEQDASTEEVQDADQSADAAAAEPKQRSKAPQKLKYKEGQPKKQRYLVTYEDGRKVVKPAPEEEGADAAQAPADADQSADVAAEPKQRSKAPQKLKYKEGQPKKKSHTTSKELKLRNRL